MQQHTVRVPLGTEPYTLEVPKHHQALLWASVPFAADFAGVFRPDEAVKYAESYEHTVAAQRITVEALTEKRLGYLSVRFRAIKGPRRASPVTEGTRPEAPSIDQHIEQGGSANG